MDWCLTLHYTEYKKLEADRAKHAKKEAVEPCVCNITLHYITSPTGYWREFQTPEKWVFTEANTPIILEKALGCNL